MKKKLDSVILALALFATAGVSLWYNLTAMSGGEVSVSLTRLMDGTQEASRITMISDIAAASLQADDTDSVLVAAEPSAPVSAPELLPPIVTPPAQ